MNNDIYINNNNTNESNWSMLILSIVGFIIFVAVYLIFLYIPSVEYENEFNIILDQANEALVLSKQYTSVIEDVNNTVNNGFKIFCIDYKNIDLNPLYDTTVFGKTFDKFCENII